MEITAALAADLALLTQALDEPGADIAETLLLFASDARWAVPSYLGLTVTDRDDASRFALTTMGDLAGPDDVLSSLLIPLTVPAPDDPGPRLVLILYASRPGAFVDLAADVSWLTGLYLGDLALDKHLGLPAELRTGRTEHNLSTVNQAVGVLMERGSTAEEATDELDTRAAGARTDRYRAAQALLDTVIIDGPDPTLEPL